MKTLARGRTAIWRCLVHMRANWLRPLLAGFIAARSCCRKCGLLRSGSTAGGLAAGAAAADGLTTCAMIRGLRATHLYSGKRPVSASSDAAADTVGVIGM